MLAGSRAGGAALWRLSLAVGWSRGGVRGLNALGRFKVISNWNAMCMKLAVIGSGTGVIRDIVRLSPRSDQGSYAFETASSAYHISSFLE